MYSLEDCHEVWAKEEIAYDDFQFQVAIHECGTNRCNSTRELMRDKNALELLRSVVYNVAGDLVGDKNRYHLMADLGANLLKGLSKPKKIHLFLKDVNDKHKEEWTLKEQKENDLNNENRTN